MQDSNFTDANWEAFKIIDPHGTGYVEMNVLKRLLLHLPGVDVVRALSGGQGAEAGAVGDCRVAVQKHVLLHLPGVGVVRASATGRRGRAKRLRLGQ